MSVLGKSISLEHRYFEVQYVLCRIYLVLRFILCESAFHGVNYIRAKAAFNKKETLFRQKLDLNLRKKLVKCYIWSMALCGAETGTLRKVDQKYLESFKMLC